MAFSGGAELGFEKSTGLGLGLGIKGGKVSDFEGMEWFTGGVREKQETKLV